MSALSRAVLCSVTIIMAAGCATVARAAPIDDCEKARGAAALSACAPVVDNGNEKPVTRAFALLLRARAELDLSDLARAEADIAAALVLTPESTLGYRLRARLRGLQGREPDARADLMKAVDLPQSPVAKYVSYLDRGYFFVRNMELPTAQADFTAAVGLDPAKAAAYVGRAVAAKAAGDIARALADLGRAEAAEPGFKLTYLERGDIQLAAKRYAEAIADFSNALELDGKDARALRGRTAARTLAGLAGIEASPPGPIAAPNSPPAAPPAKVAAPVATPSTTPAQQPAPAPQPPRRNKPPCAATCSCATSDARAATASRATATPAPPADPRSALKQALVLRQWQEPGSARHLCGVAGAQRLPTSKWRSKARTHVALTHGKRP